MFFGRDARVYLGRRLAAPFLLLVAFSFPPSALAATFTVTSTADTDGVTCVGTCTLRQAIKAANAAMGADTIAFNISGSGVHTIAPATQLPTISSPVTIDGYTQSGSSVNTASVGSNAVLDIEISGASAPAGANGLVLGATSAPSTIRGLVINRFKVDIDNTGGAGIKFLAVSNIGGAMKGCFIGTNASGTISMPNQGNGIEFASTSISIYNTVTIGGTALADRNLISGNGRSGIVVGPSINNVIAGNLIGIAADGVSLLGNGASGVVIFDGFANVIGGTVAGAGNVIAGNGNAGVLIGGPVNASGNAIERNSIFGNAGLGIDLSNGAGGNADGVTPNDAGDTDDGANGLQNFPVLILAGLTAGGGTLVVEGTLNSTPNGTFRVELFVSDVADPSGFGEGKRYLGSQNVTTDANGDGDLAVLGAANGVVSRQVITATATDALGNTSEFSAGIVVLATTTVVNTNDSGTGSLRQAILNANAHAGADTIDFAIPGAGVHKIHLLTPLPLITEAVTIDGYTQAGATANTLADGDDAVLLVEVDASALVAPAHGLSICSINTTVRGLAITGAPDAGVGFGVDDLGQDCATGSANGSRLTGSFVGIRPNGLIAGNGSGVIIRGSKVDIGFSGAGRNVVSGNDVDGVAFVNSGTTGGTVEGNLIGWAPDGTSAAGNGRYGVFLGASASGIKVGYDIFVGDNQNRIGNNGAGIFVSGSASGDQADGNSIGPNTGLGIDLSPAGTSDGVTLNDPNDVDSGGNKLQNFPVINSVARNSGYLLISGFLDRPDTATSVTYTIGVYASAACDASGYGEGERFLGTFDFDSADHSVETFSNVVFLTDAALPVGSGITLTATDPAGNTSEFSQCAPLDPSVQTFTVNSAADTTDGSCTPEPGGCTLREAIAAANNHPGADKIGFNIAGGGVHVISLTDSLTINDPVDIDGYTQPGSSPNTLADGDNAAIRIEIDGQSASALIGYALAICSGNSSVRGLSFTHHRHAPLALGYTGGGSTCGGFNGLPGIAVSGNFIGLAPDGSVAGNQESGIVAFGSVVRIGGVDASDRNVISANGLDGIDMNQCDGSTVVGNYIGTDLSGTLGRGNLHDGVGLFNMTQAMTVGGSLPNRIAFNRNGIVVTATRSALFANEIFGNNGLAIDLYASGSFDPDGPTANDVNDGDGGANDLQNFPVLTNAAQDGPTLHLVGSLDVPAGATSKTYQVAFYASATCDDPTGRGQGQLYLGYANVGLSGASQEFVVDMQASMPIGSHVAATATSTSGTSEFSPCVTVVGGDHIFANGFDS